MVVNCIAVHGIINYWPSKNIEAFVQDTGRAGRYGHQSNSFLLYHGMLLNHVKGDIKLFIKSTDCGRKAHFNNDNERNISTVIIEPITLTMVCQDAKLHFNMPCP